MKNPKFLIVSFLMFLSLIPITAKSQQVILEPLAGFWDDGGTTRIFPDQEITFNIRYVNNTGQDITGIRNGYRVWTTGGTNFTPLNGELTYPGFASLFDLVFNSYVFSADGIGADTLGIAGVSLTSTGLIDGFDDVVLKLITGNIQEGETLCIDSTWYPSGNWLWANANNYTPSWNGPQCFLAECPACIGPQFTNCTDTITSYDCATISYNFDAINLNIPSIFYFGLVEGPGSIDTTTGEWSYTIPTNKLGTYEQLKVEVYSPCLCNSNQCWVTLDYTSHMPGDLNSDCSRDISDLVYLVNFMFKEGPEPEKYELGDLNGDGTIDISDLVKLIEIMFKGGSL